MIHLMGGGGENDCVINIMPLAQTKYLLFKCFLYIRISIICQRINPLTTIE